MQQKDKDTLMQRCSDTQPSCLDVKGYDSVVDKERDAAKHNDGRVHPKNVLGDNPQ